MRRLLLFSLLCLTLLAVAAAHAAVVDGSGTDPAGDGTAGPGTDITAVTWSFDDQAGRLTVSVTTVAASAGEDWGAINITARDRSAEGCGGQAFATIRGSTNATTAAGGAGTAADGQQPDGSTGPSYVSATNVKSDEGRTHTLELTHARLVGRAAGCVQANISRNGVKDSLDVPATNPPPVATPTPGASPTPVPTATPQGPGGSPRAVRIASSRKLRFKSGRTTVALTGVADGMTGSLRVHDARARTLATGRFSARSSDPLRVRLTLNAAGRRRVRRGDLRATLVIDARLGTVRASRAFSVRLLGSPSSR